MKSASPTRLLLIWAALIGSLPALAVNYHVLRAFPLGSDNAVIEVVQDTFPDAIASAFRSAQGLAADYRPYYPVPTGWYFGNASTGVFHSLVLSDGVTMAVSESGAALSSRFYFETGNGPNDPSGNIALEYALDFGNLTYEGTISIGLQGAGQSGDFKLNLELVEYLNRRLELGGLELQVTDSTHRVPGLAFSDPKDGTVYAIDYELDNHREKYLSEGKGMSGVRVLVQRIGWDEFRELGLKSFEKDTSPHDVMTADVTFSRPVHEFLVVKLKGGKILTLPLNYSNTPMLEVDSKRRPLVRIPHYPESLKKDFPKVKYPSLCALVILENADKE